jgi:hypothetical protein
MQIVFPSRPDGKETLTYDLRDDNWTLIYTRSHDFVDSIEVHNLSSQAIYKSPTKNPSGENFETIAPGQSQDEDLDPVEIYAQRSSNVSNPKVKVTVRWFTDKQIARLKQMATKFEVL